MAKRLSRRDIDKALSSEKLRQGLAQYVGIQWMVASLAACEEDRGFRRAFNRFYRVRRNAAWQQRFYAVMSQARSEHLDFADILKILRRRTGRYEASFASKLFATLNPSAPVIDSVVLKNLGLRLPPPTAQDRAAQIAELHAHLSQLYRDYLATADGEYLVTQWRCLHPHALVTDVKKLDFVLWSKRPRRPSARKRRRIGTRGI